VTQKGELPARAEVHHYIAERTDLPMPREDESQASRREFVKKAAYIPLAILTCRLRHPMPKPVAAAPETPPPEAPLPETP
jgi:hypothetical protein